MPPLLFQLKEVYKLSLFNVNQTVASKARNTSTVPIKDKQLLIVTDLGDIFYDSDGTRVQLTDIIVLDTESQRLALTSPFEKFYFVKGSGALWRYNNSSWVKCSGGGSMSVDKVLSVASWSDNKQNIEISGLTADQNGIVGLSQSVSMEEREAAETASLYVCGQQDGSFTVAIGGDKPTCDIPITVILFG